jgi:hypothetical protein
MAFVTARRLRYETISLEQLLLALLDNPRAADLLRSSRPRAIGGSATRRVESVLMGFRHPAKVRWPFSFRRW